MTGKENFQKMSRVIANAWLDPKYKARLKAQPHEVLKAAGIAVPKTVKVHEDTDDVRHVVIPKRPAHLKDEDLQRSEPHPDLCSHM